MIVLVSWTRWIDIFSFSFSSFKRCVILMNYFSLFFSLQMNRPIQVKPADSENRGGKNKRSNHSDFWKIRQEWNNLNRFLHSFEYFSLFFLAHHHHDRWSFKFFERREKILFLFYRYARIYARHVENISYKHLARHL